MKTDRRYVRRAGNVQEIGGIVPNTYVLPRTSIIDNTDAAEASEAIVTQ